MKLRYIAAASIKFFGTRYETCNIMPVKAFVSATGLICYKVTP